MRVRPPGIETEPEPLLARLRRLPETARAVGSFTRVAFAAHPTAFVGMVTIESAQGLLPLGLALTTKALFDLLAATLGGSAQGSSEAFPHALVQVLAIHGLLTLATGLMSPVSRYCNASLGRHLGLEVQRSLYTRLASFQGLAYFENPAFHDVMRLAPEGAQFGPQQILGVFSTWLRGALTLLSFAGALLVIGPYFAALVSVAALPQLFVQVRLARSRMGMTYSNTPKERRASYFARMLSDLQTARETRAYGLLQHFRDRFLELQREILTAQRDMDRRELRAKVGLEALSAMVTVISFGVAALMAYRGSVTLGDLTLFNAAVGSILGAATSIALSLSSLTQALSYHRHYRQLMELPEPLETVEAPRKAPPLRRSLRLEGVSFRYSEHHPWVLRGVDLEIPRGKCVALVGLNGAGKTTLTKLMSRFYDPVEGRLSWDGVDLREFDPESLRRRLAVVFQDFLRYELSAATNVGLGDLDRLDDREAVRRAAEAAGIDADLRRLPEGYDTLLSRTFGPERAGIDLSGGQWQKLAIARAYFRRADLLVLDEPTAALDAEAEQAIYDRFARLIEGRTSLLISHRFSTVRMADVVAVLEDGRIREIGSHHELMGLGGRYRELHELQAVRFR